MPFEQEGNHVVGSQGLVDALTVKKPVIVDGNDGLVRRGDDGRYPTTDGRRPNPNGSATGRTAGRNYPNQYPYPDARDSRGSYSSEAFRKGY